MTGKPIGEPVRFVFLADMHITAGEGAAATCKYLTERITGADDLDFLIHVGDLGYGRGSTAVWNTWHGLIERTLVGPASLTPLCASSPRTTCGSSSRARCTT